MKKNILCLLLIVATLFSLSACSENANETPDSEDPKNDDTVISNICFDVYNEDETKCICSILETDNNLSLSVGVTYVFKIYLSSSGSMGFTDDGVQFSFDNNYISIEDCDLEDEINNTYYFTGLQATESTLLTISMSAADAPKDVYILLIE